MDNQRLYSAILHSVAEAFVDKLKAIHRHNTACCFQVNRDDEDDLLRIYTRTA